VELSDPWPDDFGQTFTVHGRPHDGEAVTLLEASVQRITASRKTSQVGSWILALGAQVDIDDCWPSAEYIPASLHEWLPETGLSIADQNDDRSRFVVEWAAPERRTVTLPGSEVNLRPDADWSWSYSPGWSIETNMAFNVTVDEPLTIGELWEQYRNPLLSFATFAVDEPDDLMHESYFDPADRRHIVVLRRDRNPRQREWRPVPGRYLFQAEDIDDIGLALTRWFEIWKRTVPSLGLFHETVQQGRTYSAPRFLTLYTAAEGYWKNTKTENASWSPRSLAERANLPPAITGATDEAVALIGATREYHAHLTVGNKFSPETIVGTTYESTRRLHALMQACLMREIGIATSDIERLMTQHYQTWPIP
jgi:hypothetical protein